MQCTLLPEDFIFMPPSGLIYIFYGNAETRGKRRRDLDFTGFDGVFRCFRQGEPVGKLGQGLGCTRQSQFFG